MQLLLLINADKTSVLDIVNALEKMPNVVEVFPTFGRFDIAAFCEVDSTDAIKQLLKEVSMLKGIIKIEEFLEI
ncbi:MAG: Lrp/AsnC ligand binding domain-containing protein [Candidatus Methanomethylicaceae archaeon]